MPFSSGFKMILRPIFQNHAKCYAKFDFKILNGDTFPFPLGGEGTRGRGMGVGKGLPTEGEFNRLRLLPLLALRFIWQTISLTKKRSTTERVLCLCSPSPLPHPPLTESCHILLLSSSLSKKLVGGEQRSGCSDTRTGLVRVRVRVCATLRTSRTFFIAIQVCFSA